MEELTEQAIDILCREFEKQESHDKVQKHILDPCVKYMGKKLWPYVCIHATILFLLLMSILYIVIVMKKRN